MSQIPKTERRRLQVPAKDFNSETVPPSVSILLLNHISGNNQVNRSLLLAKYKTALSICNSLRDECVAQSISVNETCFLNRDQVIDIISENLSIPVKLLLSKRRDRYIVEARAIAYFIMRNFCGMHFTEIGKIFNRDHSTVYHGIHLYNALYDTSPVFARRAHLCINKCQLSNILDERNKSHD